MMFRKSAGALIIAGLLLVPASGQNGGQRKDLAAGISKVDALFAAEFAKTGLASVTVGIVSGPDLVWTKSYGMADMTAKRPATKESIYRIGSITKQITALMLLQLVEKGKVNLSDPVEKYLPEVNRIKRRWPNAPPITLVQLATHTSGLIREPADTETYLVGQVARWEETMMAAFSRTSYQFEPGTHYSYSNIGYAVLGAALARAAGEPYIDYVKKNILVPLKMLSTVFEQNDQIMPILANGYIIRGTEADPEPAARDLRLGRGYKVPNGALFTNISDLARFVSFEMGFGPESVLPKQVWLDNLTRSNSSNGDLTSGYGVGFQLQRRGNLVIRGHGGSVAGHHAGAYFHLPSQTGLIFLRNAGGGGFGSEVVMEAFRALTDIR